MYQITLTAETRAELTDKINALAADWIDTTRPAANDPLEAVAEPEAVPAEEPPAQEAAEPEPQPEPAPEVDETVSLDELRAVMMAYAQQHGSTKAKALVQEYGADKVSGVAEDQRAALLAAAQATA